MALWLVRAGRHGERETIALEHKMVVIGWEELPDLSGIQTREQLAALLQQTYSDEKPKTLSNWEGQIWPFINLMQEGDLVALPLKSRSAIAVGRVIGAYQYREEMPPDARHTRPVNWLGEYPRSAFDQDLLYSLGASMTICRIQRNEAEKRVKEFVESKKPMRPDKGGEEEDGGIEPPGLDLEQYALDRIRDYVSRRFRGHGLTRLVAAILQAQGYQVQVSPEGPDGGVDVIAGKGSLGFDPPRLVVQVKSGESPVDVKTLRELQGVMKNFSAQQGLLVAWGGYKGSVSKEAARLFFEIRLWDSDDLVRMIQTHYDQLPDALQAELPLKRIWTLVMSEE